VTVPIEEYRKLPVLIREIKEICEKHNEKYQMFCKSHECPCCRKCTIENHQECKDVVIIEDIIQDVKTSVSFDDLQQQLSVISKNIQRIQENRQANAVLIRKQKERIEKDIRDLRETMNNHPLWCCSQLKHRPSPHSEHQMLDTFEMWRVKHTPQSGIDFDIIWK
jgi:hypothetical protein